MEIFSGTLWGPGAKGQDFISDVQSRQDPAGGTRTQTDGTPNLENHFVSFTTGRISPQLSHSINCVQYSITRVKHSDTRVKSFLPGGHVVLEGRSQYSTEILNHKVNQ